MGRLVVALQTPLRGEHPAPEDQSTHGKTCDPLGAGTEAMH